jgi:hypothetical protein
MLSLGGSKWSKKSKNPDGQNHHKVVSYLSSPTFAACGFYFFPLLFDNHCEGLPNCSRALFTSWKVSSTVYMVHPLELFFSFKVFSYISKDFFNL